MPKKSRSITDAEAFVRRVLAKSFNQKVDPDTLRAIAKKVSQATAISLPKKSARKSEKAA